MKGTRLDLRNGNSASHSLSRLFQFGPLKRRLRRRAAAQRSREVLRGGRPRLRRVLWSRTKLSTTVRGTIVGWWLRCLREPRYLPPISKTYLVTREREAQNLPVVFQLRRSHRHHYLHHYRRRRLHCRRLLRPKPRNST